jgi:peptidyl-prolyl cis-trans isomerase B (cyclophilin B)
VALARGLPLILALALAGCGGGGGEEEQAAAPQQGTCRDVEAPGPRPEGSLAPPAETLDPAGTHRLRVETSCGAFTVTLNAEASPKAAASVAALAESGFYDGTTVHRIVPGFVIQGGDPTGTGGGGPGYTTVDPPPAGTAYTRGMVAMAKTAADPPGTAGSQFFVVTAADAGLPPDYAVIGSVTDGLDTVVRIEALGDPATELPTRTVVIERMTLEP